MTNREAVIVVLADDVESAHVGQKVDVVFEDMDDELTLPKFVPA